MSLATATRVPLTWVSTVDKLNGTENVVFPELSTKFLRGVGTNAPHAFSFYGLQRFLFSSCVAHSAEWSGRVMLAVKALTSSFEVLSPSC